METSGVTGFTFLIFLKMYRSAMRFLYVLGNHLLSPLSIKAKKLYFYVGLNYTFVGTIKMSCKWKH